MWFSTDESTLPESAELALPGRATPLPLDPTHFVLRTSMVELPDGAERVLFGMGCFWGAERTFWQLPGVITTSVGYAGGFTPNPTYEEVCSGLTGHTEVVAVVFRETEVPFERLLQVFWENHDPTQGMRQGNDRGTQYRSAVYTDSEARQETAKMSLERYGAVLEAAGFGPITTEFKLRQPYYFAETYHQQYLAKNPHGYCGLGGTGVVCPTGVATRA